MKSPESDLLTLSSNKTERDIRDCFRGHCNLICLRRLTKYLIISIEQSNETVDTQSSSIKKFTGIFYSLQVKVF